jgi:DtxR family Mn-dependent transcriptional regulator
VDLTNRAEEVLESLWKAVNEEGRDGLPLEDLEPFARDGTLEELSGLGLVRVERDAVRLAEAGEPEALGTVRRHRLAERLLADVLDMPVTLLEEPACRFEHLLVRGIEERVCALLGHPQRCPHGRRIPPGSCCHAVKQGGDLRLVSPLGGLRPGQGGRVAYVHVEDPRRMQKLVALGLLPGTPVRLLQRYPANIFQAGYSQFAVDDELAAAIYIRLEEQGDAPSSGRGWRRRRSSSSRERPRSKDAG